MSETIHHPPRIKDLSGQRFGLLIAERIVGEDQFHRRIWFCRCDCGQTSEVMVGNLTSGNTQSCGCQKSKPKHGRRKTRTYRIWAHIVSRCTSQTNTHYADYGGRGITVCDRWKDFAAFLADMGEAPAGMSIDRIDNNGNYEPGNCRWATRRQQMQNTRVNRNLTMNGQTKCVAQWAREYGICPAVVRARLEIGWDLLSALTVPVQQQRKGTGNV